MSAQNVTLRGRLVADPEMKFSQAGKAVTNFTVVTSKRSKDSNGDWIDVHTSFWNCVAFGEMAENIIESCYKGTLVTVIGEAYQEEYVPKGEDKPKRVWKFIADDVAVSLKWDKAEVVKHETREKIPF